MATAIQQKKKFFLDEIFSYKTLIRFRKLIYDGYHLETPGNSFSRLTYVNRKTGDAQTVEIQTTLQFDDYTVGEIFSKLFSDDYLVLEQAKLIALIRFCNKCLEQRQQENEKLNEVFTVKQADFDSYEAEKEKKETKKEKPVYFIRGGDNASIEQSNKYLNNKQKAFLGIYTLIVLITGFIYYFFFMK